MGDLAGRPPALAGLFIAGSDRKRDELDPEAFIDYCEHDQVLLVLSLTTAPSVYKGATTSCAATSSTDVRDTIGCDVIELVFDAGAVFLAWIDDL